ncbi:MAG: asparaginase [Candidatus Diapherotrites archaeon CG08_land_8_20_14_0_20_34_12]|nr:MAG: asparaginase [Candidatus Diapherotrites archaeon CG08_land_8_20_14_0_20_34_12]
MAIKLFITGGTIDNIDKDRKLKSRKTHIPKMLKQANVTLEINTEKLMLKDSRDLTDSDRKLILKKCKQCREDKIIITHGTFTMAKTAAILGQGIKNKTIVLTGSMVPYVEDNSDALFNLGCAISKVQTIPRGIYITMNGQILKWGNVKKNVKKGIFEEIKQ